MTFSSHLSGITGHSQSLSVGQAPKTVGNGSEARARATVTSQNNPASSPAPDRAPPAQPPQRRDTPYTSNKPSNSPLASHIKVSEAEGASLQLRTECSFTQSQPVIVIAADRRSPHGGSSKANQPPAPVQTQSQSRPRSSSSPLAGVSVSDQPAPVIGGSRSESPEATSKPRFGPLHPVPEEEAEARLRDRSLSAQQYEYSQADSTRAGAAALLQAAAPVVGASTIKDRHAEQPITWSNRVWTGVGEAAASQETGVSGQQVHPVPLASHSAVLSHVAQAEAPPLQPQPQLERPHEVVAMHPVATMMPSGVPMMQLVPVAMPLGPLPHTAVAMVPAASASAAQSSESGTAPAQRHSIGGAPAQGFHIPMTGPVVEAGSVYGSSVGPPGGGSVTVGSASLSDPKPQLPPNLAAVPMPAPASYPMALPVHYGQGLPMGPMQIYHDQQTGQQYVLASQVPQLMSHLVAQSASGAPLGAPQPPMFAYVQPGSYYAPVAQQQQQQQQQTTTSSQESQTAALMATVAQMMQHQQQQLQQQRQELHAGYGHHNHNHHYPLVSVHSRASSDFVPDDPAIQSQFKPDTGTSSDKSGLNGTGRATATPPLVLRASPVPVGGTTTATAAATASSNARVVGNASPAPAPAPAPAVRTTTRTATAAGSRGGPVAAGAGAQQAALGSIPEASPPPTGKSGVVSDVSSPWFAPASAPRLQTPPIGHQEQQPPQHQQQQRASPMQPEERQRHQPMTSTPTPDAHMPQWKQLPLAGVAVSPSLKSASGDAVAAPNPYAAYALIPGSK